MLSKVESKVESIHKIYCSDNYKRNRNKLALKLKKENLERLACEVQDWKVKKLLDPFCFCPFYDSTTDK